MTRCKEGGIACSDIRVPELCEGGFPVGTRAHTAFRLTSGAKPPCAGRKIVYNTAARRAVSSV